MRVRIFLSFVLIALVSVLAVVLVVRWNTANEIQVFMFRGGMVGLDTLANQLEDYYATNQSWSGVDQIFTSLGHGMGLRKGQSGIGSGMMAGMSMHLQLADANGILVLDNLNPDASGNFNETDLSNAIALRVKGKTIGYLLAEGGMTFNRADQFNLLNRLNRAALTAALIAVILSLFLAFFLSYRLLKPVKALTLAATNLANGDLSQRVDVNGKDELATLGNAFNQMAGSLQHSEGSRQAMTADIAHELRTPLAVQRAQIEAMQDGIFEASPENLDILLQQNLLLTRLVNDLSILALTDAGQLHLEYTLTDPQILVQKVIDQYSAQAMGNQVKIEFISKGACQPILVDSQRIEQILGNLVSNALRYAPQNSAINISLDCTTKDLRLEVRDEGPGIPDEALPYVFDRFYKADRSRTRTEGGSGLGLAIASRLAEMHGGTITAANHPGGGAVFTLFLPRTHA
jgi:signal transduction histidine kinase